MADGCGQRIVQADFQQHTGDDPGKGRAPATALRFAQLLVVLRGIVQAELDTVHREEAPVAPEILRMPAHLRFLRPVNVGDVVTCYAQLPGIGRTSMKIRVEAWVQRYADTRSLHVTEGTFTYVAIDDGGKPQPVKR